MTKLQPSAFTDQLTEDGHQLTKLPYPFFVNEDGSVRRQDVWAGQVVRVVGFQRDLAVQQIDLWWKQAVQEPERAVGMYLVTADSKGDLGSHSTAISSVEVIDTPTEQSREESK